METRAEGRESEVLGLNSLFHPVETTVLGSVNLSSDASLSYTEDLGSCRFIVLAVKSVWQYYVPVGDVHRLLDLFRQMVNDSIRIGLLNDVSSLRRLSILS